MKKQLGVIFYLLLFPLFVFAGAITSVETPYTVMKVRKAVFNKQNYIIGSGYNGELVCIDYKGNTKWTKSLSGLVNHDLCCSDIDNDGNDEIFVANASGTLYCIDKDGNIQWTFKKNDVPLYSVCIINNNNNPIVVCGGYDLNIYCISPKSSGFNLLSQTHSKSYSITRTWGDEITRENTGSINFLRTVKDDSGKELLAVHGTVNANSTNGAIYIMDVTNSGVNVLRSSSNLGGQPLGSMSVYSTSNNGDSRILMGSTTLTNIIIQDINSQDVSDIKSAVIGNYFTSVSGKKYKMEFGYRVTQIERLNSSSSSKYLVLDGEYLALLNDDFKYVNDNDIITAKFAYNDMFYDSDNNLMILASTQSGGNCIHIVNLSDKNWKSDYKNLVPPGNMTNIIRTSEELNNQLSKFTAPSWERKPLPVYFMSEDMTNSTVKSYIGKYSSPLFFNNTWANGVESAESWSRDTVSNVKYRDVRDGRQKYTLTEQQVIDKLGALYNNKSVAGYSYWGGHGNDPFYYSLRTLKDLFESKNVQGTNTVLIYPELGDYSSNFQYVMDNLFLPLANYGLTNKYNTGVKLYIRTKNIFWLGDVYQPVWKKLISGEYANSFIASMEETSSRMMDLTSAARLGIWTSGAVNSWGSRCAKDNVSYDRLRQYSQQMLPTHFLRTMVFHISYGAQYLDNFGYSYLSPLLWDLIGKGLLYVPKREEIVSFNPVHLTMITPDNDYMHSAVDKWTTFYDETKYNNATPMVFDRLNATWCAAAVNEWDFSRYAAGVKDRRLNFLPSYPNGMVLITPPSDASAQRGDILNHLHPMYRNIFKEYKTDGKYYWVNGVKQAANTYYKTIESDLKSSTSKMPITVEGEVAWIVAQTSPTHLRLTLIDGGYIDPSDKKATITFHSVNPKKLTDLASGEKMNVSSSKQVVIDVPAGFFRFIDVELKERFY